MAAVALEQERPCISITDGRSRRFEPLPQVLMQLMQNNEHAVRGFSLSADGVSLVSPVLNIETQVDDILFAIILYPGGGLFQSKCAKESMPL